MPPRKRLGQLLTELGVIDEHQLQSALGHQKQWGGKLGTILVQKGFIREEEMVRVLSQHVGMPSVKLSEAKVDQRAVKLISKQIAEKLQVFAFDLSGAGRSEVVTVAMSDPTDLAAVDQLAFHTGKRIKTVLAGASEIVGAIHKYYEGKGVPPLTGKPAPQQSFNRIAPTGAPAAAPTEPPAPAASQPAFHRIAPLPPPSASQPAMARVPAPAAPPPTMLDF